MNVSAVFVYLNSRCALGDLLPLFFRMDRLTFIGPTVRSGNSMYRDTQPDVRLLRTSAMVIFVRFRVLFSSFCLALHCCPNEETHTIPNFATFIRLVFDTFGRMPIIRMTVSCTFLSGSWKHDSWFGFPDGLLPFGTFLFASLFPCLLSLLGDRGPGEGELDRSRLPFLLPFLGDVMFETA